jgi:hypothetical protein
LFLFIGFGAPDHRDGETRKSKQKTTNYMEHAQIPIFVESPRT